MGWWLPKSIVMLSALVATAGSCAAAASVAGPSPFDTTIAAATAAMQFKPLEAARLARQAKALAQNSTMPKRSIAIAAATWLEGEAAMRLNESDIGGPLIRNALETARRDAPGSKLHGDLLLSFARLQSQRGHPEEALAASQSAYSIFSKLKIARSQAVALQSIGSIYQYAADFEKVLYYYNLADQTIPDDLSLGLTSSNNRANAFRELGRIDEAIKEDNRALTIAKKLNSPVVVSRILANLASAQIAANDLAGARTSLQTGLYIASQPGNGGWHASLLAISVNLALSENKPHKAVALAEIAFKEIGSEWRSQSYRSLHFAAYQAYKALSNEKVALKHFEIFNELDNQSKAVTASTSAKLMSAQFDFVTQNSRIAILQSGQLRRDIELARLSARQQAIIFSALLILAATAILFLFIYLRSMRINGNKLRTANAELQVVNFDLEKALVAKSLFLATTSHEIRTPLNGVLGMAQVILADGKVDGKLRDKIKLIEGAGNTMKALVDDILDLAKMESGEYEVVLGTVDPSALLVEVGDFWRPQAQRKNLIISLDLIDLPPFIGSDATRLRQVLFNLISNAIKFTYKGEIRIVACVVGENENEEFQIDIIDTGMGIPSESHETIFDKFHQLDQGTARQFGGSGLGLAISRHIVRALGGDIFVSSAVDGGTQFTVRFPFQRIARSNAEVLPTRPVRARTLATSRIAIAGASPITASILCAILKPFVAAAASVTDLETLEVRAVEEGFDIILLDGDALRTVAIDVECYAAKLQNNTDDRATIIVLMTPPFGATHPSLEIIARPIAANVLIEHLEAVFSGQDQRYYLRSRSVAGI